MPKSYGPDEYYSRRAREEGVPARSYFKLEEMDKRLQLLRPGHRVLDLGCWPGSWTLYAARRIGPRGRVMGVDLKQVTFPLPANAKTTVQDAFHLETAGIPTLDVVLSDMAPKTMGNHKTDHSRSAQYVALVMNIADAKLGEGGSMLAKMFDGEETKGLLKQMKLRYETGRILRPQATRSQSNEIYLVGTGKLSSNTRLPSTWKPPPRAKKPPRPPMPHSFSGW